MLCNLAKVRTGQEQEAALLPQFPTHLGKGTDTAEELGMVAGDCSAVYQRLGKLWSFREVTLSKLLGLVNSSCRHKRGRDIHLITPYFYSFSPALLSMCSPFLPYLPFVCGRGQQ